MSQLTKKIASTGAPRARRGLYLVPNPASQPPEERTKKVPKRRSGRAGSRLAPGRLPLEIPEDYKHRLSDTDEGNLFLRLTLRGTIKGFPFLAELYRRHQVESKIAQVWLEFDDLGAQYGQMLIEISGSKSRQPSIFSYFGELGIKVEILGCLRASKALE